MGARLGPYNLALVACYAAPTWGAEAIKALTSPFGGLIDPVHAATAVRLRAILNLSPERLLDVASWLAAFKLVVVAALLAYVIEFARAVLSDRAPDRATTDTVLASAVVAFDCRIIEVRAVASHNVFFGAVEAVRLGPAGPALVYHERAYKRV